MLLRTSLGTVLVTVLLSLSSVTAKADQTDVTFVIDRKPNAIELYFTMRADLVTPSFGVPNTLLADAEGSVDFSSLRMGTFDIGDTLFQRVHQRLGTQEVTFEAMSLMVHPRTNALPLQTPLDGMIAIAVCTVPAPDTPVTLEDLQLYAGYIAYVRDPDERLVITLPLVKTRPLIVEVRTYAEGSLHAVDHQTLSSDAPSLTLAGTQPKRVRGEWIAILVAFAINACAVGAAARAYASRDPAKHMSHPKAQHLL